MKSIVYCNPFVPPELITAHGLMPVWLRPRSARGDLSATHRGVCPAAAAIIEALGPPLERQLNCRSREKGWQYNCHPNAIELPAGVVLTTTCDQMRYAAAMLGEAGKLPVFLFDVPRTWKTDAARTLYIDELRRLGRFLESVGGERPSDNALCAAMVRYDRVRQGILEHRDEYSACEFAAAIAEMRGWVSDMCPKTPLLVRQLYCRTRETGWQYNCHPNSDVEESSKNIPLALVGGPLLKDDDELLEVIEQAGGRIVLDATESGERTLPAPLDEARMKADPLAELARIYFDSIPDIFRRPNDDLFAWLARETSRRGVRGVIVRRHLWCDLWHAALPRLREQCGLPLLEWEQAGDAPPAAFTTRIEAFMEMLGE